MSKELINELRGLNDRALFLTNDFRLRDLQSFTETTRERIGSIGRDLRFMASLNQEAWRKIISAIKKVPAQELNVNWATGSMNYVAKTFINYLRDGIVPMGMDYSYFNGGEESERYLFYDVEKDCFRGHSEEVKDDIVLGRLVEIGQINLICVSPVTFLSFFGRGE